MTKFSFSAPQTYICELNQYSSVPLLKGKTWQEKLVLLPKYWERRQDSSFEGHSSHFSYFWLFGLHFLFWWHYLLVFCCSPDKNIKLTKEYWPLFFSHFKIKIYSPVWNISARNRKLWAENSAWSFHILWWNQWKYNILRCTEKNSLKHNFPFKFMLNRIFFNSF